ncbi:MAG: hypothetical protein C3F18_05470 [Nitrosomonadales bacterium]|nr:MAG: hypothetical protein C3F18_05470 [Nitrosomonadales bacterium]
MYLDRIHTFQTGVSLEISTAAIQALIADATEGDRFPELVQIKRPEDIFPYLTVTVHRGADALMQRRSRWAREIRNDVLAGKAVSYGRFTKLFWRDIDEEDPDGDEWHRHFASTFFAGEITSLLDKVRSAQRALQRSNDVLIRMNWDFLSRVITPKDQPAF